MITRRTLLSGLGAAVVGSALAEPRIATVDELKPGQFTWYPERAPAGAVAIVVSIPDQRVYVYRNGVRIGVSTCSTGKPGHETPTGIFTILQKDKHHRSSTYNNAPMPNMNRLTWSGIALHAGNLPGYPASHGCVRLPMEFSAKLFTVTQLGAPVIIADAATYPTTVLHPGLVLSDDAQAAFTATEASLNRRTSPPPEAGSGPSTSILISSAESRIVVLQDGRIVASGSATISEPSRPLGNHVYILSYVDETNRQMAWRTIGYYDNSERSLERTPTDTLTRIRGSLDVVDAIRTRMSPGTTMVTVDLPLSADTRTGKDFVILADHADS
jgi:hypothetical protein